MSAADTYQSALAKLQEAFGKPWAGTTEQARFDIKEGLHHTAVDLFDQGQSLPPLVSLHTLAPHHEHEPSIGHLEYVALTLSGCMVKQWARLPGALARRHRLETVAVLSGD